MSLIKPWLANTGSSFLVAFQVSKCTMDHVKKNKPFEHAALRNGAAGPEREGRLRLSFHTYRALKLCCGITSTHLPTVLAANWASYIASTIAAGK